MPLKSWHELTPPRILVLGFSLLIALGTLLLALPVATRSGQGLSWVDALFTATSATAVTGLVVVNTGDSFSLFGQLVIMFLIQVGGLGFMVMATLLFILLGRRITLKERLVMQEALNQNNVQGVVRLARDVALFALTAEALGGLLLAARWAGEMGWGRALYLGFFHAVSAFNNAGFDLFSSSLVGFRGDVPVNLLIMGLFILGGLGYGVFGDVVHKRCWRNLHLHSKLVLSFSAGLLLVGFLAVLALEYANPATLASLPLGDKLLAAFFQGATPRTAGFNTLPTGELRPATQLFVMLLMFVGASSGSTGGGIKTTTFAVLVLMVWQVVRGGQDAVVFGRRLNRSIVFRAMAVAIISLGIIILAVLLLLLSEGAGLQDILFEVVSAFGTVGLSTGLTPELSLVGKLVIVATMFVGRLGPLTLAFALAHRLEGAPAVRYPEEKIMVG